MVDPTEEMKHEAGEKTGTESFTADPDIEFPNSVQELHNTGKNCRTKEYNRTIYHILLTSSQHP